jgi:hypothetical protein
MSEVTDMVKRYRAGDVTFDELTAYFVAYRWQAPSYIERQKTMDDAERWLAVEDRNTAEERTWGEVILLYDTGVLTEEELDALTHAVDEAHGDLEYE